MKIKSTARTIALISACAVLASPRIALAQERAPDLDDGQLEPGQTVADRRQENYAPTGIRMGSFVAFPEVTVRLLYDDNVFFENTNESEDYKTLIEPRLSVRSDWTNHELRLDFGSDITRHDDFDDENSEDYFWTTRGRLDVTRQTFLTGSLDLRHGHEGRGSPDAVNGVAPTETDSATANVGFEHRPGKFFLLGNAQFSQLGFDDVTTSTGLVINNDDRDRNESSGSLTLGYEIQPGYNAFIRGTVDERDYDDAVDDAGFNRDSTGVDIKLGAELDLGGTVNGEVNVGAFSRDFDDARFEDVDGWSTESVVYWQLTPLTTVVFNATRSASESTELNASSFVASTFGVAAAHELRRNLLLEASISYTENEFEGINRTDEIYSANISATYDIDRFWFSGASYEYGERDSDVAGVEYDRNVWMLWLGYRR
ncbi:MAG: outer membrane beta-barrel protein [Gammaproteobacteria bacterium]